MNSCILMMNRIAVFIITLLLISPSCAKSPSSPQQIPLDGRGGGLIAFESERSGTGIEQFEVYVMNADGTAQTRLTNNSVYDGMPYFSPDGTRIVFASTRDGNYEIYTMNIDGTNVNRLTNNSALDLTPKWSPDGAKIVFGSHRDGNSNLYVIDADGNNLQALTTNPGNDGGPDWSPTGDRIAFYSDRGGNRNVYIMKSDGSNAVKVTNLSHDNYQVDWSPIGDQLAFVTESYSQGMGYDICIIDTNGTNLQRITSHWGHDEFPEWSPDGSRIAFGSTILAADEIHVMSADGSNVQRLTESPGMDFPHDWIPYQPEGIERQTNSPGRYSLENNYPNPFNPVTRINYTLSTAGYVTLMVYDLLGKETAVLAAEHQQSGMYSVSFDASNLPSGVYFYQLKAGSFNESKKMILAK